jgi:hypothetical protein
MTTLTRLVGVTTIILALCSTSAFGGWTSDYDGSTAQSSSGQAQNPPGSWSKVIYPHEGLWSYPLASVHVEVAPTSVDTYAACLAPVGKY